MKSKDYRIVMDTQLRPVDYWVEGMPALNIIVDGNIRLRWCVVKKVDIKNNRLFIKYSGHRLGFWVEPFELVSIEDVEDLILL